MKTVLYLDASDEWARLVKTRLPDNATLWAVSPAMARDVFVNRGRIDLVAIGDGNDESILDLVAWLRQHEFKGPVIVATYEAIMREPLVTAGCIQVSPKESLPDAIRRWMPST